MRPEIVLEAQATLGEGPAWDAKTRTLYWVDILEKRVHFYREGENGFIQLEEMPGCLAPCKDRQLILALSGTVTGSEVEELDKKRLRFASLEPASGKLVTLASVSEPANNRFNDGKCDPAGRFLAGSMDLDEKAPSGALYSFAGSRATRLLDGVRISNGLAWSPDHKTFYYIDTPTREVKAFDYDLGTGQVANPRVVISVPEALGWPDGMTSDTAGNLWIAMWGGTGVTCWNPNNGNLLEQIPLPAKNATACVFGGNNLNELYITSARKGLDSADLTAYRHSGSLMRVKTRVQGMPTFEFE